MSQNGGCHTRYDDTQNAFIGWYPYSRYDQRWVVMRHSRFFYVQYTV